MKKIFIIATLSVFYIIGCKDKNQKFDASGTFEAEETIVSAEAAGKILELNISEGDTLGTGKIVGKIDPLSLELQKAQIEASNAALQQKTNDAAPQIAVLESQITTQKNQIEVLNQQLKVADKERKRISYLVTAEAVPSKQLDDINGQMDVLNRQINAAQSQVAVLQQQIKAQIEMVSIQNRAVLSEQNPLAKRIAQVNDQLSRTLITNPVSGTVLIKYMEKGEVASMGKPIYKLGNMDNMTLRAYLSGSDLSRVKTGQTVKVMVDNGAESYKELQGTIQWISEKAEFTPKTIQTKDERANLVYAIKVKVKNDGYLKIGQYGEVIF
ncbi:MAG: HlyD family secretion protein [Saprospiraceae bacterium]